MTTTKKSKQFFWGASTASHQVEGHTENQWTIWERVNAERLAKTAESRYGWLPNWPDIKDQATDPENYLSGKGCRHYLHYKEDFAILKKLNLNAFRFSIHWARFEPEEGKWDLSAIDHYKKYIRELNKQDIEPFLNLWHFAAPVWFTEKGGFAKRCNLKYFEEYVKKIADELLDGVNYVITLNEPNVYSSFSYGLGLWPPQEKRKFKTMWVYMNLVKAHKISWKVLKAKKPKVKVGVAQHLSNIQPLRPGNLLDEIIVKIMRYSWNWWFLNRIDKFQDFVGMNYYFTDYYKGIKKINPKKPINDLGWYMEPTGLLALLQRTSVHYPKKPIIVTENGVADTKDQYRKWWLEETMIAIKTAQSQGVPIIGYLHWSLLDNFEWADGWWPKFGLVEVDRKNMKRNIRPSALWWAKELKKQR